MNGVSYFPTIFGLVLVKLYIQLSDLREITSTRAKNEAFPLFSSLLFVVSLIFVSLARKWQIRDKMWPKLSKYFLEPKATGMLKM